MGSWCTGGYHYPVKVMFLNQLLHHFLCILGAGKEISLGNHDIWKSRCIFHNLWDVNYARNVDTTVTDKYTNPGLLFRDILLWWICLFFY